MKNKLPITVRKTKYFSNPKEGEVVSNIFLGKKKIVDIHFNSNGSKLYWSVIYLYDEKGRWRWWDHDGLNGYNVTVRKCVRLVKKIRSAFV